MQALHNRTVDFRDNVERWRVLSCDYFRDRLETMLMVADIDALGGTADGEIAASAKTGGPLQRWNAVAFGGAGVDGTIRTRQCRRASVRPTISEACNSAERSGRRATSIGVGTAMM